MLNLQLFSLSRRGVWKIFCAIFCNVLRSTERNQHINKSNREWICSDFLLNNFDVFFRGWIVGVFSVLCGVFNSSKYCVLDVLNNLLCLCLAVAINVCFDCCFNLNVTNTTSSYDIWWSYTAAAVRFIRHRCIGPHTLTHTRTKYVCRNVQPAIRMFVVKTYKRETSRTFNVWTHHNNNNNETKTNNKSVWMELNWC